MRAFSLVELSIVLVILGLLTGGILAGQSLVRAAELRAVAMEYQRYNTAIHAFRDKYLALPGDFRDATRFWRRQKSDTDCATNSSASVDTTNGVCDGNGDGSITSTFGSPDALYTSREMLQAWRHMAAAGLVEGQWRGQTNGSGYIDENNTPPSRLKRALWSLRNVGDVTGTVTGTIETAFALNYRNALELWGISGAILTPQEAWGIDRKFDDGMPAKGNLIGRPWSNCTTATARTDLEATYDLLATTQVCSALFFRGL